jgi:HK97 family phage major capsid protein
MSKLPIPETAAEMQEMMDDPKVAAQIVANGQLSEFTNAYATATDERGELAELVKEAVIAGMTGTNTVTEQVQTAARETFATMLREHGVARPQLGSPGEGMGEGAEAAAERNPTAPGAPLDGLFANLGDYARVAYNKTIMPDDRLEKVIEVQNAYSSSDPASAGTLIPEEFRSDIYELALETAVVRPRASVIQMASASISLPYVDVTTHASGTFFGGMSFAWTPESGTVTATEAKFGRVKLEAKKLTGGARVPNELWNDAPALNSWLMRSAPQGITFTEDVAFLTGVGGPDPLGIHNAPATITLAKEGGQTAATIVVENILKMYSRVLPQSLPNSVWVANPTTFPELMTLALPVGTGGAPVALVNIHASPTMTMLGRPLILSEKVPTLGSAGDIGIYDFSFYLIGDRQSVSMESSEHSRFMNDETEVRLILRVDGRPWIQSALTPKNGSSLSPFVILAARA